MDKKTSLIIGSVFILTSGLLYTIERLSAYIYWFALSLGSEYPSTPEMPSLLANLFVPLLFVIGIIIFVVVYKDKIAGYK